MPQASYPLAQHTYLARIVVTVLEKVYIHRESGIVDARTATKEEIGLLMTTVGGKEAEVNA